MIRTNKKVTLVIFFVILMPAVVNLPASKAESPTAVDPKKVRTVAIVIHDGVELLDFAGPGQVFASAKGEQERLFEVYTVSSTKAPITSQGFLTVTPQYSITDCPEPNIIVIPGGDTARLLNDAAFMEWYAVAATRSELMMTVCSGAFVPAKLNLLDGLHATTFHGAIEHLRAVAPKTVVLDGVRFVDNGNIITTAGVSAGIDGALHIVARLHGDKIAKETADYMEYDCWNPKAGRVIGQ
jgi:transcriptional regulator GlxA family with amidase domain